MPGVGRFGGGQTRRKEGRNILNSCVGAIYCDLLDVGYCMC